MKALSGFACIAFLAAAWCLFGAFSADTAHACKYPCVSNAPTTLNQVTPPPSPVVSPPGTSPTSQQMQQCQNYAQTVMTGTQLYSLMQTLPAIEQNAFFKSVVGMGGGMNDLQYQTQTQMFGGNMTAYNQRAPLRSVHSV
jgi:hypothetical protein